MELEQYLNEVCEGGASLTLIRSFYFDEEIEALLAAEKAILIGCDAKYSSIALLDGDYESVDLHSLTL